MNAQPTQSAQSPSAFTELNNTTVGLSSDYVALIRQTNNGYTAIINRYTVAGNQIWDVAEPIFLSAKTLDLLKAKVNSEVAQAT